MPRSFRPAYLPLISFTTFLLLLVVLLDHVAALPSAQQKQPTAVAADKLLDAELDSLAKHIEQINSTISAFQRGQELAKLEEDSQPGMRREEEELKEDRAQLERLGREREEMVRRRVDLLGTRRKSHGPENGTDIGGEEEKPPELKKKQKASATKSSQMASEASKVLCQFFVFGILFGVVCSISACSCFFHSRRDRVGSTNSSSGRSRHRPTNGSVEEANLSRLSQIREPFAPDKPFCLKFDEHGLCYASPLTREVPPLPGYEEACKMTTPAQLLGHKMMANSREKRGDEQEEEEGQRSKRPNVDRAHTFRV